MEYATDGATSRVRVNVMGDTVDVTINAVGEHWATNVALALLAATMAGIAPKAAAEALSGYAPPAGRGVAETLHLPGGGTFTLVDDSYNANPESMRAAIAGFASRPGRRIVALGEMRELGATSAELHASLAGPIVAAGVTAAVLSGPGMTPLCRELSSRHGTIRVECVDGAAQAADVVQTWLMPGDAVLIKGSNASGMARVGMTLRKLSESVAKPQKAGGASDAF